MKKITKILAVLAAMTTLAVSAMPTYAADETASESSDDTKHIDFDDDSIPKSEKACMNLNSFISDNDLCAYAYPVRMRGGTPDGCFWDQYGQVHICIEKGDTKTKETVQSFINENCCDPGMFGFIEYEGLEQLEKEASLLNKYFEENQLHGNITYRFTSDETFFDKWNDCEPGLVLNFRSVYKDESIEEKIYSLLEENGFDKGTVSFNRHENKGRLIKPNPNADADDANSNTEITWIMGDANEDGSVNVRDCVFIAGKLAKGRGSELPENADYNADGKTDIRDAADIAKYLAAPRKHRTGDIVDPEGFSDLYARLEAENILDKSYTLRQLFAMSDEEFLTLGGRKGRGIDYYNEIKQDAERVDELFSYVEYGGISGKLVCDTSVSDSGYRKGTTEEVLVLLFNDTVKYDIFSPTYDDESFYSNFFKIVFPDYKLYAERDTITDEQIMKFAKIYFCADQAFDLDYEKVGTLY